ncbi:glyoxylate reductase [Cryptotrichosporon argae]
MLARLSRTLRRAPTPANRTGRMAVSSAAGKKVLFLDRIRLARADYDALAADVEVIHNTSASRAEFLADLETKYAGVEGVYRHFKASASIQVTGRFDAELVERLPDSVNFICHNGAGYDQIDVAACTARGIQVSAVPHVTDAATADTACFLLLGAVRRFGLALAHARRGTFNADVPLAHDPAGKVLGIVGMGGIGRALALRARAFGFVIKYHNRTRLGCEVEDALGATYVDSLDDLLATADAVSLHCPLNPKTRHLLSADRLRRMKSSAVLVNTARGPVVDEVALVAALEDGTIAGAALDVYEHEPAIHPRLLEMDNVLALPHVATVTRETQERMEEVCLRNLRQGLETGKLGFTVSEQKGMF